MVGCGVESDREADRRKDSMHFECESVRMVSLPKVKVAGPVSPHRQFPHAVRSRRVEGTHDE